MKNLTKCDLFLSIVRRECKGDLLENREAYLEEVH